MTLSSTAPIHSTLSTDPDMAELVVEFVEGLQTRAQSLEAALAAEDVGELTRLAHQLKGASGGYGFELLGEAARSFEQSATEAASAGELAAELEELVRTLRRATAEPPPEG